MSPLEHWENLLWADLPSEIEDALTVLGWNASIWNNGGSAPTDVLPWAESFLLSSNKQLQ